MGLILRLIKGKEDSSEIVPKIYVDFENATPTEEEQEVYKQILPILEKMDNLIESISSYAGATAMIRRAIANANDQDIQNDTKTALKPLIKRIEDFYDFSVELAKLFPALLKILCGGNNHAEQIIKNQALARACVMIIEFSINFDVKKQLNPSIQNDLSYYRRSTTTSRIPDSNSSEDLLIPKDKVNKISMFLSGPNPMMLILLNCISKFLNDGHSPTTNDVSKSLVALIKICNQNLENPELSAKIKKNETREFIVRAMTGCIVIYDHIDLNGGAYRRDSPVNIRDCINTIKSVKDIDSASILNFLRFNSKHLNDPSTPCSIKQLLGE